MTTKHTPGPWKAEPHLGTNFYVWPVSDPKNRHTFVGKINGEANARLIAAAPDAIEALRVALAYLEAHRPSMKRDGFYALNEHENAVIKPIRAALAKAGVTT